MSENDLSNIDMVDDSVGYDTCQSSWVVRVDLDGAPGPGSVEISKIAKFRSGYIFFIALWGEYQNGIFITGLVSHLAGWNFILKFEPPIEK